MLDLDADIDLDTPIYDLDGLLLDDVVVPLLAKRIASYRSRRVQSTPITQTSPHVRYVRENLVTGRPAE